MQAKLYFVNINICSSARPSSRLFLFFISARIPVADRKSENRLRLRDESTSVAGVAARITEKYWDFGSESGAVI